MNDDLYDDDASETHRLRNGLLTLALGAVLYACWRQLDRTHRSRLGQSSTRTPERLQTWENEGGRPDADPTTTVATGMPTV